MTNLAVREEREEEVGQQVDLGVLVVPSPVSRAAQPERRLMLAVLESAITDWLTCRDARSRPRRGGRVTVDEDLCGWFTSSDVRWPYSFESICSALGLDADGIRGRLGIA